MLAAGSEHTLGIPAHENGKRDLRGYWQSRTASTTKSGLGDFRWGATGKASSRRWHLNKNLQDVQASQAGLPPVHASAWHMADALRRLLNRWRMDDALCPSSPAWEGPGPRTAPPVPGVPGDTCGGGGTPAPTRPPWGHLPASPAGHPEPEGIGTPSPTLPCEEDPLRARDVQTCRVRVGCLGSHK